MHFKYSLQNSIYFYFFFNFTKFNYQYYNILKALSNYYSKLYNNIAEEL